MRKIQFSQSTLAFLSLLLAIIVFPGYEVKAQTSYTWKNVAIGGGGFVSAIIPSKTRQNLVYARTDVGGAYRWDAATSSWIPLTDWVSDDQVGYLGVESLALDPNNAGRLYMLVGIGYFNNGRTAILRSNDYGNSFTITEVTAQFKAHGNGMGRQTGEKLVVDPNNSNILYCGTRSNGLFKSTDAGATWSRVSSLNVTTTPNENGISFVVLDGSSVSGSATERIIVGVSRSGSTNLYRSDNGGQSFTAVSGAPTNFMPHRAVLAGNGNLYVTYGNGAGPHGHSSLPEPTDNGQIWRYNISTGVWTNITPSGFNRAFGGISVDPNNPNRLVASTINTYMNQNGTWGDRIFLSTNGGSSWVDVVDRGFTMDTDGITWINGHSIHWAGSIEFDPFNTQKVWVTSGNGIFVNDNVNTSGTWRFNVRGLEETVPLGLESIPNGPVISVIGDYTGFRHTTNNLNQYAPIHTPQIGTTTGLAVAGQNTSKIVRVGNTMYYSTDMGLTWTQSNMNGSYGKVALSANGNIVLHSPQQSSVTYRSTDNGSTWSTVSGLSFNEAGPVGDPVNSNKFYAYNPGSGAVMVSTNGGASFSQAGSVGTWGSKVIRLAPGMEGHVWIALNNGGLTRSTNSGQSFSTISGVSYCGAVGFGVAAAGANYPTIYIWGTVNNVRGVYRSTDQGASWVRVNDDAHEYGGPGNGQFVQGDMNVFGRVYMSTAGRGIVYGDPAGCTPTAITPYVQVNGGTWQQAANATVAAGGSVQFGPQPLQGGSWSWSGPNNFSAATREAGISNIQVNQAGNYVATHTDSGGCQSTQTFNVTVTSVDTGSIQDPNFHIYLVFGQSNMEGAGAIESQDRVGIDERFKVMGALDCTGGRTHQLGKWTTATPPLVRCWTGLGISDYFGRTMVQELPSGIKIGIVPVAVGGCDIALFDKVNYASYAASAPSWMKDVINSYGGNPYGRLVEVAKLAKKEGVIKGILFHQGETNTNNTEWKNKVADVARNLKTDLQLGDVPFLAGELLASTGACCGSHNVEVNKLPSVIPNAHVISSAGLVGADPAHFTSASYREFGKRYAKKMIELLGPDTTTCTPTAITPYVQLNGGAWQQTANASVAQGDSVKYSPQPATGGSWSWSGPNNFSATTREVTIRNIQSTQAGNYVATCTNSGGCQSTQTFSVTVTSAAIGGLYPNPANKGRFTILLTEYSENAVVKIYDNLGRMLFKKNAPGGNRIEIDSRLKPGIYHVRVNSKAFNFTKKLIVK